MKSKKRIVIRILIGTKGQFIKMAPVLCELEKRKIEYQFIHAGQHTKIIDIMSSQFNLKPDVYLSNFGTDIVNEKQIVFWLTKNIIKYGLLKNSIFLPTNEKEIILNHGDAPPALLGLAIAKLRGIETAHIEAGERTYNLLNPFPEEFIRQILDRYSTYKFASSRISYKNLIKEKSKGFIFNIKENTLLDAVRIAVKTKSKLLTNEKFVLASIHRYETIRNRKKLFKIVKFLERIANDHLIVFPVHPSTKDKLLKFGLFKQISSNENIIIVKLLNYFEFIKHLNNCEFIFTDGGGPQQESYYLGKPCLLIRETTERLTFSNVVLSKFKSEVMEEFIKNYSSYNRERIIDKPIYPSSKIVDILSEYNYC